MSLCLACLSERASKQATSKQANKLKGYRHSDHHISIRLVHLSHAKPGKGVWYVSPVIPCALGVKCCCGICSLVEETKDVN